MFTPARARRARAARWSIAAVLAGAMLQAAGCAPDGTDVTTRNAPIIGGVETFERPEVGYLTASGCASSNLSASPCVLGCTATIVSSHVAITAAHCVRYESRDTPGTSYGQVVLSNGQPTTTPAIYRVVGYRSFGRDLGRDDIALLRLEAQLAPGFAVTPVAIASSLPPNGDTVDDFGYGCTNRSSNAGAGVKRKYTYRFDSNDEPNRGCPGDSGGPHIASAGQIIRINSGWTGSAFSEHDLYGDPVRHFAELRAQIAAWDPAPCTGSAVACGAGCADLQTDRANCGSCGGACGEGAVCLAGLCTVVTDPCGDGVCDPSRGEDGARCARDCCDAQTDCDATLQGAGQRYCRSMNGGPYRWITADEAAQQCNEPADVCRTTWRCAARSGTCGSVPGGFRDGLCTDALFDDVPASDPSAGYIDLLYRRAITSGCSASPLRFCPDDSLTRGQMAVFVMRGAFGEDFAASSTPYFTDVPADHPFFRYVQGLRDRGITSGCSADSFCVDGNVTQGEAAVFIVRARLGEGFTASSTPYFTDVPADHPFFRYVQKARELGINPGCAADRFCVDAPVTRAQMAAMIARGLLGAS